MKKKMEQLVGKYVMRGYQVSYTRSTEVAGYTNNTVELVRGFNESIEIEYTSVNGIEEVSVLFLYNDNRVFLGTQYTGEKRMNISKY